MRLILSSLEPFLQTDLHDLSLLFGGFAEFSLRVVLQAALTDFQNL